jgi:hypothetical protein
MALIAAVKDSTTGAWVPVKVMDITFRTQSESCVRQDLENFRTCLDVSRISELTEAPVSRPLPQQSGLTTVGNEERRDNGRQRVV